MNETEISQDKNFIYLQFPIPKVSSSKISSTVTDFFFKLNIQEEKYLKIFDFAFEINSGSVDNSIEFLQGVCKCRFSKLSLTEWDSILLDSKKNKELVKERRSLGLSRLEEIHKKFYDTKNQLKIEHDRHATSEMMRVEQEERNFQESLKAKIKEEAEFEIYKDLQLDSFSTQEKNVEQEKIIKAELPIRQTHSQLINFTEKVYPHIAMRESQLKDAPLPKIKALAKAMKDDVGLKNPLWLKDKGDEFFANSDYYSAINAYSSALALRPEFEAALANRAAAFLKVAQPEATVLDCQKILEILKEDSLLKEKCRFRMAVALTLLGELEKAKEIVFETMKSSFYNENSFQGENLLTKISLRVEAMKKKSEADSFFKIGDFQKAKIIYEEALLIEPQNEWILANLALVQYKLNQHEMTIITTSKAKETLKPFPLSKISHDIITKLNLRASASLSLLEKHTEAISLLQEIILFDPSNEEVRKQLKGLEMKENEAKGRVLMAEASAFLSKKDFSAALECLEKASKYIDCDLHVQEYLSIMLNKCLCFAHFSHWDDIISTCLRGIRVCRAARTRLIGEEKSKIESFELRFLVRRSNAYASQGQFFSLIKSLQCKIRFRRSP